MKKQCLYAGVLLLAFTASSRAALPSGAFHFNGSLVVTQNTITWISNGGVAAKATMGLTGSLPDSAVPRSPSSISTAREPVGMTFPAAAEIVVVPEPALTALIGAGLIALSFGVRRPRKH